MIFADSNLTQSVAKMDPSTTLSTMVTPAPYLHHDLLLKRVDGAVCGDLQSRYPNAQAPMCTGQTSICSFKNGLQGCCDSSGSCRFYSTCNGAYATDRCTGSQCLACAQSAPYCTKYSFINSQDRQSYEGYSCGNLQLGSTVVYGVVPATSATLTSTSSSGGLTSVTSRSTASSSSGISTSSTGTTAEPTASLSSTSETNSHTGAIVGGVVGSLAGLVLLGFGAWLLYSRWWRNRHDGDGRGTHHPVTEPQQHYNDNSMTSLNPNSYRRQTPEAQQHYDNNTMTTTTTTSDPYNYTRPMPEAQQRYDDNTMGSSHAYGRPYEM